MLKVQEFFDKDTCSFTYVVYDSESRDAFLIDPVLNFDPVTKINSETSYSTVKKFIQTEALNMHLAIETHLHADHITAAKRIKRDFPEIKLAINGGVKDIIAAYSRTHDAEYNFDLFFSNGDILKAGTIELKCIHTPGHTTICTCILVEDKLFVGDTIFMPDFGTGRCDFPGGNAEALYESITKSIYTLPKSTEIYVGHDYQPGGRNLMFKTTVAEELDNNIHINSATTRESFIKFRSERDSKLKPPRLLADSIPANLKAGA